MALEKAKQAKAAEEMKALTKKREQEQKVSHIMATFNLYFDEHSLF